MYTKEDLVQIAFAGPDLEDDFQGFKDDAINDELGINEKRNKILSQVKAGWGDWAGPGASGISPKILGIIRCLNGYRINILCNAFQTCLVYD
jgi:U3 small nucleolar RNA-associated protein 14